jgi:hypothetical protein
MKFTHVKEKKGGDWIVILGCPIRDKHSIFDKKRKISGPSFADCNSCEYQAGTDTVASGAEGDYAGAPLFPERLKCGLKKSSD